MSTIPSDLDTDSAAEGTVTDDTAGAAIGDHEIPLLSAVYETKIHPPMVRAEWIDRRRLIQLMDHFSETQLLLVAGPAGYGKSVLVAQWAAGRAPADVAWVQLDPADNDPTRLWAHVAAALELAGCTVDVSMAEFIAMSSTAILTRVVPRVAEALTDLGRQLTLVLEDYHVIRSSDCDEQLERLIDLMPAAVHLVLVSRSDPRLRLARLRVEGRLSEIRTGDLSFTEHETAALLATHGVELSDDARSQLVRLTEGWPAAIYLAALSLTGRSDPEEFVQLLNGSDRYIADYLSEEVLARIDMELRSFILTMSIFDRFNASLANDVAQIHDASRLLHRLERTNMFVTSLHGGGWFRFHHLFATFARSALELDRPGQVPELHRRGAHWFVAHDHQEEAIAHLLAAGDGDEAAALIQSAWARFFDAGRSATVLGWLHALHGTPADRGAAATVTDAWMGALTGDIPEMRRRLVALEAMHSATPLPDGTTSPRSALLMVRGLFGYDGPDQMLADARGAFELEDNRASAWHPVACAALGHAGFVTGDVDQVRRLFGEAAESPVAPRTIQTLSYAMLALNEAEQGNAALSRTYAHQAMQVVTDHAMEAMPNVTHAYTAYGTALAGEGRLAEALEVFETGLESRRRIPGLSPWPMIYHLIAMATAIARSGDRQRAEALLAEVDALTPWPDQSMALTRERIAKARKLVANERDPSPAVGEALTQRELEILQRLHGTQTLREIASDLFVSHNTVKTTTLSIYRKLGAHSRAEAVALSHSVARDHGNRFSPG